MQSDCSIREYWSNELCTMHIMSALLQFTISTDLEHQSIFMELSSIIA